MTIGAIQFIVIDLFCGAGGTTTGFEQADFTDEDRNRFITLAGIVSDRPIVKVAKVVACVNHDPIAIKSHWSNHPDVQHFEEDITTLYGVIRSGIMLYSENFKRLIRLVDIYRAYYPDAKIILWASLECTNFSKAKGGKPRDADSRTLAHHLHPYIVALEPDYIKIENVVEFMSWGPLDSKGKPVSKKNGRDWIKWRQSVNELGYHDDWKELNAADFGALTSRNRLFGCFARPGYTITWPAPTHSKNPEAMPIYAPLKKWEPVKKALDFEDEGKSVFNRDKALSTKTMQRLFMGCVKHIAGGKNNFLSKYYSGNPMDKNITTDGPAGAIKTKDSHALVFITKWNGNDAKTGTNNGCSVDNPAPVITTQNRLGVAFITKAFSANSNKSVNAGATVESPCPTISVQNRLGLAQISFIDQRNGSGEDRSKSVDEPAKSLTSTGGNQMVVQAHFIQKYYSSGGQHNGIDEPAATLSTKDRLSKVSAFFLDKKYSADHNHSSIEEPAGTIVTNDKHNLVEAEKFILNTNYDNIGSSLEKPLGTITADRHYHYIVNLSCGGNSGSIEDPCHVVIARQDKAPLYLISCQEGPVAVPVYDGDCEWTIKLKEFMALYGISDIKMRMLKVPELKVIQGFPSDYVLLGNQTDQKKFIGNAVHPTIPKAWISSFTNRLLNDFFK